MLRDATLRDGLFFSQRLIFFATFFFPFPFFGEAQPDLGANTAFSACGGGAKRGPEASCGNFGAILRVSLKLGLQRSGTV